jgi:hypothetical protein
MRKYIVGDVVVSTVISEIMVSYLMMIFQITGYVSFNDSVIYLFRDI